MKILYVMPTQYRHDGELFRPKRAFFPTLTLPYIAGLTPKGIDVTIKNDYVEEVDTSEKWDLVGITISTLHARRGYELADEFRASGNTVVMGGFHATFMHEEAGRHADCVVIGEAESVLPKLIEDHAAGRLQKTYKAEGLHSLKGLPCPRYDLINYKKYGYRSIPAQTTRGCPFNCDYCTVSMFHGRKFRFRPVGEVVEDLRSAIKTVGSRLVMFIDDNIAVDSEYSYELFEAITPLRISWVSQCTLGMADDAELVRLAARSGMRGAFIGVETLNASTLRKVNKKVNSVEKYAEKIRVFSNAGVSVSANMIFGFEADGPETFEAAYKFLSRSAIYANPYILTPYPGTKFFDDTEKAGKLLHRDWWKFTAYQQVVRHERLGRAEMEDLFWKTYLRLYSPRLNFRKIFKRPWRSFFSPMDWFLHVRIFFYNATFVSRYYIKRRLPPYF